MKINFIASAANYSNNKNNRSRKQNFGVQIAGSLRNVLINKLAKTEGMYDIYRLEHKFKEIESWDNNNSILVLRNSLPKGKNHKPKLLDIRAIYKKGGILTSASKILDKGEANLRTNQTSDTLLESFLSLTKEEYLKARTPILKEYARQTQEYNNSPWFLKGVRLFLGEDSFKIFNSNFSKFVIKKERA